MFCTVKTSVLACINPHIMNIYGLRYYLALWGFQRLFIFFSKLFINSFIIYLILKNIILYFFIDISL